jgi:multiple antibiotic resistance protein
LALYAAIVILMFATYFTLREAHRIINLLGQIGINVLSRLMGLVLAAIAVQFIIDGIKAALPAVSR